MEGKFCGGFEVENFREIFVREVGAQINARNSQEFSSLGKLRGKLGKNCLESEGEHSSSFSCGNFVENSQVSVQVFMQFSLNVSLKFTYKFSQTPTSSCA
jgi:hypothetical protein